LNSRQRLHAERQLFCCPTILILTQNISSCSCTLSMLPSLANVAHGRLRRQVRHYEVLLRRLLTHQEANMQAMDTDWALARHIQSHLHHDQSLSVHSARSQQAGGD
jgi:hypothetical protein